MRVAVANVTSGGVSGGYRKYLARLMPLLAADPRITALTVVVPDATLAMPGVDVRAWDPRDARSGFRALRRLVASLAPDVVFVPTARAVPIDDVPIVTMVRNMEPLEVPFGGNTVREGLRNLARRWEAKRACRRAARVLAVSRHVRDFLVGRWGMPSGKIGLAYHGVDSAPAREADAPDEATLFTAGSIRPARGLEDLIEALSRLDGRVRLRIAGRVDSGCEAYGARLRREAERGGVADRIDWLGQLDDARMSQAFHGAGLFVMTSRAEACPNTVLEAMASGCASVSVDRAPMPEFFSDAARYYRAGDGADLASRVAGLLDDTAARRGLAEAARRRAQAFTWESTRDQTIEELQRAAA